jgi:micrococcal nuclease
MPRRWLRLALAALLALAAGAQARRSSRRAEPPASPQLRPAAERVPVDPKLLVADDGDTVVVRWSRREREKVRILGIDAPELRHLESEIPYAQPKSAEARDFARRTLAGASSVELLRAPTLDQYGRTLGYLLVDGKNYSALIVRAQLAQETVSRYGDDGFPKLAAEVTAAARDAGPPPFEPPGQYRNRMRELSRELKARGEYPDK